MARTAAPPLTGIVRAEIEHRFELLTAGRSPREDSSRVKARSPETRPRRVSVNALSRPDVNALTLYRLDAFWRHSVIAITLSSDKALTLERDIALTAVQENQWKRQGRPSEEADRPARIFGSRLDCRGLSVSRIRNAAAVRNNEPLEVLADELLNEGGAVEPEHRRMNGETLRGFDGEVNRRLHLISGRPASRLGG